MPRVVKKFAVRPGKGSMCFFCGKDCGRGGGLKRHVESKHFITYDGYVRLFKEGKEQGKAKVKVDKWIFDKLKNGKVRVEHIFIRHFTRDPVERYIK